MTKHRKVRKYGNTWVVVLTPTDAKDNNLDINGWAEIDDIIFKTEEDYSGEVTPQTEEQMMADKNISDLFQVSGSIKMPGINALDTSAFDDLNKQEENKKWEI